MLHKGFFSRSVIYFSDYFHFGYSAIACEPQHAAFLTTVYYCTKYYSKYRMNPIEFLKFSSLGVQKTTLDHSYNFKKSPCSS